MTLKEEQQNSVSVQTDSTRTLNFHIGKDMDKIKTDQLVLMLIYCLDKMFNSPSQMKTSPVIISNVSFFKKTTS